MARGESRDAGISQLLTPVSMTLTAPTVFGCFLCGFGTCSLPPRKPGSEQGCSLLRALLSRCQPAPGSLVGLGAWPGVAAPCCELWGAAARECLAPALCSFCLAFSSMSGGLRFILQPFKGVFCCRCFICITTVPEGCSQAGGLVLLGAVQMQIKTVRSPKSFLASG